MCPKARLDDGQFHITIIEMGRFELLYNFNTMYSRCLHPHKHVTDFSSKKVRIEMVESDDEPYIGQVDGEIVGDLPIDYDFLPGQYEFIKPEQNEAEQWFQENHGKKFTKYLAKLEQQGSDYYSGIRFD